MTTSEHLAKHFREVYFGGNWTAVNLKTQLKDVSWQDATRQVFGLNTIATLLYHLHYYVRIATRVLEGGPLEGSDKLSFDHPPIHSQEDWQAMQTEMMEEAMQFAHLIEAFPDDKLSEDFADPKYGDAYRNLAGIIEHTHYHLGQISLIKKILLCKSEEQVV